MKRNNACEEMKLFPGEAEVSVQLRLNFGTFAAIVITTTASGLHSFKFKGKKNERFRASSASRSMAESA